jgi:hypothetical protein
MTYDKLSKDEFEGLLGDVDLSFKRRTDMMAVNDLSEYVYSASVQDGFDIVIYSSVSTHTNKVRAKGSDAIHLKIHHNKTSGPVLSEPKTLRTDNWDKNLRQKIENAVEKIEEARPCGECGDYLVRREGQYGEFFGCINYPECSNTEQTN